MKTDMFQEVLFKLAIATIACDGLIDNEEIDEIKRIVDNEIYFMGFNYFEHSEDVLNNIKAIGSRAIDEYLNLLDGTDISDRQKLQIVEVLIRVIDADDKIDPNEIKFLQLVIAKLKIDEEKLFTKFPSKIGYFIHTKHINLDNGFSEDLGKI